MTLPSVGDTGLQWQPFAPATLAVGPAAASVLFSVLVDGDGTSFEVHVDDLYLFSTGLFVDGFESGDTSAWSSRVAQPSQ